jgi:hypothetical protein
MHSVKLIILIFIASFGVVCLLRLIFPTKNVERPGRILRPTPFAYATVHISSRDGLWASCKFLYYVITVQLPHIFHVDLKMQFTHFNGILNRILISVELCVNSVEVFCNELNLRLSCAI